VQRFQTTRSLADSRRAFVINAAGDVLWMTGLSFVGLALLAYFTHHPTPPDLPPDQVLPYFMANVFPPGAVGLVIAAILAASLSSIDSAVNACTSVVVIDLYNRFSPTVNRSDRSQMLVSRTATVLFGLAGTLLATNVSRIGTLLEIANKLVNAFTGPLFGIYLLAMFSRRATGVPVLIGGLAGTAVSYLVAYHTTIGFMWPSTFGLAATLAGGFIMTALSRARPTPEALQLTWWGVMRKTSEWEASDVRHLR
jgi:solute:Na+ symporter, SSS family